MKKYVSMALFIFWVIVIAILVADILKYAASPSANAVRENSVISAVRTVPSSIPKPGGALPVLQRPF